MIKSFEEQIRQKALELGFCSIGFAETVPLIKESEYFKEWIEKGYNADMKYLSENIEKRFNPTHILPEAKTIIVTGCNYFSSYTHPSLSSKDVGKVSRYAWGEDYHKVILNKLENLSEMIKILNPEAETKAYVDTGSIHEKQWAVRAGIGWQGKNSLILTNNYGSFIFLGIIITSVKLLPDSPIPNHCGDCNKCIESCPTNAITAPGVIDARRCIAYWTINKFDIPGEVAGNLDGCIFGCDICQDVCPWNHNIPYSSNKEFYPKYGETTLDLSYIDTMTQIEFTEKFRNNPIKKLTLDGLKRNASVLRKCI